MLSVFFVVTSLRHVESSFSRPRRSKKCDLLRQVNSCIFTTEGATKILLIEKIFGRLEMKFTVE